MIHWGWLLVAIGATVIASVCLTAWLVANSYSEQTDELARLTRENQQLKLQLEEVTAAQLKAAAHRAMGD